MATTSSNLSLRLPTGTDFVSVSLDISGNFQTLDDKWATSSAADIGAAAASGSALTVARSDHVHRVNSGDATNPGLPIGESNSGLYRVSSGIIAGTIAGARAWSFDAAGLVSETALSLKHVASVAARSGYVKLFAKSDGNLYKHTAGDDEVRVLDADLFTAEGTLLYGTGAEGVGELAAGTSSQVLRGGTTPSWGSVANAHVDASAAIALSKLAAGGSDGQVVTQVAGALALAALPSAQVGYARGSSSGPATSSTSYADLTDMSVTLTTVGGDLACVFSGIASSDQPGQIITVAFSLDAAAEVGDQTVTQHAAANAGMSVSANHVFTSVSAGSHTVKVRWKVGGNNGTFHGTQRSLMVTEV